jgi:hypothetical protein
MRLRQLLPVVAGLSLLGASGNPSLFAVSGNPLVPRADRIGDQFVFVIPHERIDPGDRRPR